MAHKIKISSRKTVKPIRLKANRTLKRGKAKAVKPKGRKALKSTAKRVNIKTPITPELMLEKIGEVTHYFPHVNAAAVKLLRSGIAVGDKIYLKGHTTDFKEQVRSIQLDHESLKQGKKGQEIGLFVKSRVRIGDSVYKL